MRGMSGVCIGRWLWAAVVASMLAACGGGGGSAGSTASSGTGNSTTGTDAAKLALVVYDDSGNSVHSVNTATTYTARATLTDSSGVPIQFVRVDFSTADTNLALGVGSDTTTSAGVASTVVSPSSVSTGGSVTLLAKATVGGKEVSATVSFNVSVASASDVSLSLYVYNSAGTRVYDVDNVGTYTAKATLVDSNGAVLPNERIDFSTSDSNLKIGKSSDTTSSTGVASSTLAPSASSTGSSVTLTAKANVKGKSVSATVNFNVSTVTTADPTLTLFIYNATNARVYDVASTGTFTAVAVLKDATGVAVQNTKVDFSSSDSNLSIGTAAKITDSAGSAATVVSPSTTSSGGAVTLTAHATTGGRTLTESVSFNVAAGAQPVSTPNLAVGVYNVATGVATSSVSLAGSYEVRGTLSNASGSPMSGVLVSFSLGSYTNAVLGASTAVTDASGVARVSVAPSGIASVGGALVTAQTASGSSSASGQGVFSVTPTAVTLQPLTVGSATLASAGSTPISVQTSVSGFAVTVTFTASCGRINGSALSASVTTNGSGLATATYEAVNADGSLCNGAVSLSAATSSASPVNGSLTVQAPVANAITYSTTDSVQLFVKGSGGLEQGTLRFRVLDTNGNAVANENVVFSIVVNPGGLSINSPGNAASVTSQSDATGYAKIAVFSGTIPGPMKIRATLQSNSSVFSDSQNVRIASGPASQRFISVSVDKFNIEGWSVDGSVSKITARVADRQGNAVENGTVVNFTAEGGQVGHSCATVAVNNISSCTVEFQSQSPRPLGGRVSVLAFLEGTKDYVDMNFNNTFDTGTDTLLNLGDAFRDDNENGVFDAGEFRVPRGVSGGAGCAGTVGGSFPSVGSSCNDNLPTTVRQEIGILFSSSAATITQTYLSTSYIGFSLSSFHNSLLPMPVGTDVSAKASSASGECAVDQVYGTVVTNIGPTLGSPGESLITGHGVGLKKCASGDTVAVTVKSPLLVETTRVFTLP